MRIGVDLGGTKTEVIALDERGVERFRRRVATPQGDYGATVHLIGDLVENAERATSAGTVGVGIPGTISPATGLVKNANSTWLNGEQLREDLERRLARRLRIANDANCFALSEATDGAAEGADVVFGVIVGTGTGAGVVVHGRIVVGANAIAGEWGHNPVPWPGADDWPGPACYCGRTGCLETFLSGPGLARDHERTSGLRADASEIAAAAERGEPPARVSLERYEDRMARGLASVMNVLDPDVIVLGGGLSNIRRLYDQVPRLWSRYVFSDAVRTRLVPAVHGDASGVRGAACLWTVEGL
jgi:fructokinase